MATIVAVAQVRGQAKSLSDAIAAGEVQARFTSNGSSSGDSVIVTVSKPPNAGPGPLVLSVPPGLRLNNSSGTGQSMVIASVRGRVVGEGKYLPETSINVSDNGPVTYLLAAYCAEFSKDNPSPKSTFVIEAADPTVSCILGEAQRRDLTIQATQAAVWSHTDLVSFDDMNHKFPISLADWTAASADVAQCRLTVSGPPAKSVPPTPHGPQQGSPVSAAQTQVADVQTRAEAGDDEAQVMLGLFYETGHGGLPKDYISAAYWLQKAAKETGNPRAMVAIAQLYEKGLGFSRDYRQAVEWYAEAAAQNDAHAEYEVARMYETGLGVERDKREAAKWYKRAETDGQRDVFSPGQDPKTAMERLAREGYPADSASPKAEQRLVDAARNGESDAVVKLLTARVNVNANVEDETPLLAAIIERHTDIVRILLSRGANPNQRGIVHSTPLVLASTNGDAEVVELLLANGARIDARAGLRETPLIAAAMQGHTDVVRVLLKHGAYVNARGFGGWTALMSASFNGHVETVRVLLANRVDVNATAMGSTALDQADSQHHSEVVRLLKDAGGRFSIPRIDLDSGKNELAIAQPAAARPQPVQAPFVNPSSPQTASIPAGPQRQALEEKRSKLQSQIEEMKKAMYREQGAAQSAEADAVQFKENSRANSNPNALDGLVGVYNGINIAGADSSLRSAGSHRQRQQDLRRNIERLEDQLAGVEHALGIQRSASTPAWRQEFLHGDLVIVPDHLRFDHRNISGDLDGSSFDAQCSELKEWQMNKANFMNLLAGSNQQYWTFHVKMKDGRNYNINATNEEEITRVLQSISKACGQ